jgi:hypothetical protein
LAVVDLSVLIPTTGRRPEILAATCERWEANSKAEGFTMEILTTQLTQLYTWGEGCNQLLTRAKGEYVALVPDDVLPCEEGLFATALKAFDENVMPLGIYFHENGEPLHPNIDLLTHGQEHGWSRCFLLPQDLVQQLGPMIDATWYADVEYSERLLHRGWKIEARDNYWYTHLEAPRDWLTDEEEQRSRELYEKTVKERDSV